jgi:predicted small metal-binding protein
MQKRKVADCRKMPGEKDCTITIAGSEEEVVPLAVYHAITTHGHDDTPELEKQIRDALEDEK